ncbi:hypothetical protein NC653_026309 [Populus alba x Populus x berolinensis]|uniref:Uncharacterized protein n=1 Tax=Populus alba x Populus x berolinensis TaxID=444605 RepID=A0AAD6MDT9_9ROSI|nr:hypothetical protein NC653_026309 [Populus alba x Populus x berolinensis]
MTWMVGFAGRYVARFGGVETSQGSEGTPHKTQVHVQLIPDVQMSRSVVEESVYERRANC